MTINERVRIVRESEKLNASEKMTMERFGKRLGVQKSAISKIEKGQVSVSDQIFKSICREFDVNPEWLRNGTGEMFKEKSRNDQIADFIDDILKNEPNGVRARMIAALSTLNESDWDRVAQIAHDIVDNTEES